MDHRPSAFARLGRMSGCSPVLWGLGFAPLVLLLTLFPGSSLHAQSYCITPVTGSYGHGITNFTLNGTPAINRTSSSGELYINTGITTTLKRDSTYTLSISHVHTSGLCTVNFLRVWIDFNHNYRLNDNGEAVVSINDIDTLRITRSFTVPSNAVLGATRMRVTAKMGTPCGHILPSPCDSPADPLTYHGEVEDYTVNIVSGTGAEIVPRKHPDGVGTSLQVTPNPFTSFTTVPGHNGERFVLYDVSGKLAGIFSGERVGFDVQSGIYFLKPEEGNSLPVRIVKVK